MFKIRSPFLLAIIFAGSLQAQIKTLVGPPGSGDFGYSVTSLSNGNFVVTDPYFNDGAIVHAGAVYLYDGKTHALISTLKGKSNNDLIGMDGVFALPNGNFVVLSHSVDNGSIANCSAITWINGITGLSGVVSPENSIFGTAPNDSLGSADKFEEPGIVVFDNGNYALISRGWDNGLITDAGAVTLLNGNGPTSGFIGPGNSLVGSSVNDRVGSDGIFILDNDHFIVRSFSWNNGTTVAAGAVTWCNGISLTGEVSSANSLVGSTTGDFFGNITPNNISIKKLTNGNFVVINPFWDNGDVADAGAVTWGSNISGLSGVISSNNSLVGTIPYELVGGVNQETGGVVALSNGNYVVATPGWNNADTASNAGAVTWGNGAVGVTGTVSANNSLVGSSTDDQVGSSLSGRCGIVALTNGNYVVATPYWHNGVSEAVGAVTWGNGTTGTIGKISVTNSLVGSTAMDFIPANTNSPYSINMVTALSNGNYVVCTPNWDNGSIVDAGAVTWADGNAGITGEINSNRSLIGKLASDKLGIHATTLPNGNYVVCSPYWDNGDITDAGAVTWANGTTGIIGFVDSSNSLVGSQPGDSIGIGGGSYDVTVLNNGNYVISSPYWNNGVVKDAGAATWGNGATGITGSVNSSNSLVGTTTSARVSFTVTTLTNGNYVIQSPLGGAASKMIGAVTWGNGYFGTTGVVTSTNSLMGNDLINPIQGVLPLHNGNYLVLSYIIVGSPGTWKGSVTWGNGLTGAVGIVSNDNSLVGTSADDRVGEHFSLSNDHYVVVSPRYDNGNITDAGAVTLASTTSGITGVITSCNSILGESANNGGKLRFAQSDVYGYLICGEARHNVVYILQPSAAAISATNDSASANINGNAPVPLLTSGGCNIIATITPNGSNPVNGNTKAKIWLETTVPENNSQPFVARHFEITPALNASPSTAKITLYFTQHEFDDFNAHPNSTLDLPKSENDTAGIAHLRIVKYSGVSSNGTGLPASYQGTPEVINPNDANILWNNNLQRWEISFDVPGFSGFIVQTNISVLPLTLLEFAGHLADDTAVLEWKTADEINTSSFDIERSIDGRTFAPVGNVIAISQPGNHTYGFNDVNISSLGVQVVFYRLKLIDLDGKFTYSRVIRLVVDDQLNVLFYPNPVENSATMTITSIESTTLQVEVIDNVGRLLRQEQWTVRTGTNSRQVNMSNLPKGIYYLTLKGKDLNWRIRFMKL